MLIRAQLTELPNPRGCERLNHNKLKQIHFVTKQIFVGADQPVGEIFQFSVFELCKLIWDETEFIAQPPKTKSKGFQIRLWARLRMWMWMRPPARREIYAHN